MCIHVYTCVYVKNFSADHVRATPLAVKKKRQERPWLFSAYVTTSQLKQPLYKVNTTEDSLWVCMAN